MINAAGESKEPFEPARNIIFDLFRRHTGIESGDNDHRDFDGREEIDREADEAGDPNHAGYQTNDDDQIRIANGKAGHRKLALASSFAHGFAQPFDRKIWLATKLDELTFLLLKANRAFEHIYHAISRYRDDTVTVSMQ